jgi:hypothetical protein
VGIKAMSILNVLASCRHKIIMQDDTFDDYKSLTTAACSFYTDAALRMLGKVSRENIK